MLLVVAEMTLMPANFPGDRVVIMVDANELIAVARGVARPQLHTPGYAYNLVNCHSQVCCTAIHKIILSLPTITTTPATDGVPNYFKLCSHRSYYFADA